ncbi:MAG TPA: hypothetical protein VGF36_03735, partial [Rhodopila sp.]
SGLSGRPTSAIGAGQPKTWGDQAARRNKRQAQRSAAAWSCPSSTIACGGDRQIKQQHAMKQPPERMLSSQDRVSVARATPVCMEPWIA